MVSDPLQNSLVNLPLNQRHHVEQQPRSVMDLVNSAEFRTHVEELLKQCHTPGIAIAVVHDQDISSRGFGCATLDPPRDCTPDTIFDIASCSKSMTAASVGLLVEDDAKYPDVQWDAVMNKLLSDEFMMSKDEFTQSATLEDILSHRSGLPTHDSSYLGIKAGQPDTPQTVTRNLRNLKIAAPIRTKWMYCNMMYTVASYLVEHKSGMTFEDFLHQHFFKPLNMTSTHLQPDAAKRAGLQERMAMPYEWRKHNNDYLELQHEQAPEAQGAGSIQTSVNDYIKYIKAMLHQEAPITDSLYLGLTRLRAFCNPNMDQNFYPFTSIEAYALGWEVSWYRGMQIIQHDGLIAGFAATHFFLPGKKFGGVLFANAESGSDVIFILVRELIDQLLGVPTADRVDWSARQHAEAERLARKMQEEKEQLRQELYAGIASPQPQELPLSRYVGQYWNAGYKGLKVQVEDDRLFVDAYDRSFNGMRLTFEHIKDQTQYIVHLQMGGSEMVEELKAEFRCNGDKVVQMGIDWEEDLDDLIWFDKVE